MKNILSLSLSSKFKVVLVILALIIGFSIKRYTDTLVEHLQNREKQLAMVYARSLEYISNSNPNESDFTFIFENIIQKIDFPIIYTDAKNTIDLSNLKTNIKNIYIDSTKSSEEIKEYLSTMMRDMDSAHMPYEIKYENNVIGKIHYGDSFMITRLRYYPYVQILVTALFIIVFYLILNYMKIKEQTNIWIGMAKETAHQLGTPLSSLMGWNEMLKLYFDRPEKVTEITNEVDKDIEVFNKITQRFSKIGSKPELKEVNLYDLVNNIVNYFIVRLPQKGQKVSITLKGNSYVQSFVNPNLFEWVIENLIKNSLDAIGTKSGFVNIELSETSKILTIDVTDNGKGIESKLKKYVFRPGYSTKKRGWGLGLSLSKRIVEEYHNGKIFIKSTAIDQGTTFRIILRKQQLK